AEGPAEVDGRPRFTPRRRPIRLPIRLPKVKPAPAMLPGAEIAWTGPPRDFAWIGRVRAARWPGAGILRERSHARPLHQLRRHPLSQPVLARLGPAGQLGRADPARVRPRLGRRRVEDARRADPE